LDDKLVCQGKNADGLNKAADEAKEKRKMARKAEQKAVERPEVKNARKANESSNE
jgi:hypothetical protein